MEYFDRAVGYLDKAKRAMTKTETEAKVCEALSRSNWGASSTQMREIANLTQDYQEYGVVMKEVWNKMDYPKQKWRQIFKSLVLLEYLVKHGAERVIEEARSNIYKIKGLTNFSYKDEDGRERGNGIRENAKKLVELLENNDYIREERRKAKKLKNKYTGLGNSGVNTGSSYDKYDSYDNGSSSGRYRDDEDDDNRRAKRWDEDMTSRNTYSDDKPSNNDDDNGDDNLFASLASKSKNKLKKQPSETEKGSKFKVKLKGTTSAVETTTQKIQSQTKSNDVDDLLGDLNDLSMGSSSAAAGVSKQHEPDEDLFAVSSGQNAKKDLDPFADAFDYATSGNNNVTKNNIPSSNNVSTSNNNADPFDFTNETSVKSKDNNKKDDLFDFF